MSQNDDSISRQGAIDALTERFKRVPTNAIIAKDVIENLPSTQPELKTGRWIYGEDDGQDGWYCSECNGFVPWDYEYYGLENIDFIDDFKVCPFCEAEMISRTGADMRGEQDQKEEKQKEKA